MSTHRIRTFTPPVAFTLAAVIALFCTSTLLAQRTPSPLGAAAFAELKYRYIGPVGNRVTAVAGVPGDPLVYYVGAASGESSRQRTRARLGADFRRPAGVGHWRARGGALRSEHRLGRHRRAMHPQQHLARHGDLQVDRRRKNLDADGTEKTGRIGAHHRSTLATPTLSTRLPSATRTGRSPSAGSFARQWRQDVGARAVRGREHRLCGRRDGSE